MKQPSDARVLVIVPAWNEQGSVAQTVTEIYATNPDVDVLVVDDGSIDATAAEAEGAGARVCRLPFNVGVGGAMRAGYRYAIRHDYDVAVQIDADGQHDPRFLPKLQHRLEDADVVIGARFAEGSQTYHASFPRRAAMRVLARVMSRRAGTRLTDVTSGYRLANRKAMEVFAAHYPAEYLGDTVESLVIALRCGCVVTQEPVDMRPRAVGQASQTPLKAAVYLLRVFVALSLSLVRRPPQELREMWAEKR